MTEISTKESPFSPGRPVQPEHFVARIREIQRLERAIRQTISGRNENFFIAGKLPVGTTFTRSEILSKLQEKERKNLDNFLQKTKGFGIIVEGEMRAEYKFVNPLYHLFVWLLYKEKN
jgi:Cdc6-like AAA superfamily ATPase